MPSSLCLPLVTVLTLATSAQAFETPSLDAPLARSASLQLSPHRATPVGPRIRTSGSSDLVLNGLLLVGVGLVAGAGGFALMAVCAEGTRCYSPTTTTVAWILAAPGIIPLAVGAFMIYLGTPHGRADLWSPKRERGFALTFAPMPGGGALGALGQF